MQAGDAERGVVHAVALQAAVAEDATGSTDWTEPALLHVRRSGSAARNADGDDVPRDRVAWHIESRMPDERAQVWRCPGGIERLVAQ